MDLNTNELQILLTIINEHCQPTIKNDTCKDKDCWTECIIGKLYKKLLDKFEEKLKNEN